MTYYEVAALRPGGGVRMDMEETDEFRRSVGGRRRRITVGALRPGGGVRMDLEETDEFRRSVGGRRRITVGALGRGGARAALQFRLTERAPLDPYPFGGYGTFATYQPRGRHTNRPLYVRAPRPSFAGEPAYPTAAYYRYADALAEGVGEAPMIYVGAVTIDALEAQIQAVQAQWGWKIKAKLASKAGRLTRLIAEHDSLVLAGQSSDDADAEVIAILIDAGVSDNDITELARIGIERDKLLVEDVAGVGQLAPLCPHWQARNLSNQKPWAWDIRAGAAIGTAVGAYSDAYPAGANP